MSTISAAQSPLLQSHRQDLLSVVVLSSNSRSQSNQQKVEEAGFAISTKKNYKCSGFYLFSLLQAMQGCINELSFAAFGPSSNKRASVLERMLYQDKDLVAASSQKPASQLWTLPSLSGDKKQGHV